MSKPKKKTIIRHELPDGTRCKADAPGAVARRSESKKYYAQIDANGARKSIPLCAHFQASFDMLKKLQVEAAEGRLDIADDARKHNGKTLTTLLAEWEADTVNGGASADHAELRAGRCKVVFDASEWRHPADVDLVELRETLQLLREAKGLSDQTQAHYVNALRQFGKWLVDNNRAKKNPFAKLDTVKAIRQVRPRRELTADELTTLLAATRDGRTREKLTGEQRAWLYVAAAATGYRASELASVTPANFTWGARPMLSVGGDVTKNDKDAGQPLPPVLAESLEAWVRTLPPALPLWPGHWAAHKRGGKMLKKDAAAARVAWIAEAATPEERATREAADFLRIVDAKGLVIDFHALRHTYITLLAKSGISLKALMELARHSSPELSMRYTHTGDGEKWDAVARVWDKSIGCSLVAHGRRTDTESGGVLYSKSDKTRPNGQIAEVPTRRALRSYTESGGVVETEGEGFEPTDGASPSPVFKTGALNRSAIPPSLGILFP